MKRRFSAINNDNAVAAASAPTRQKTKLHEHESDTEVTDVEEHSALEVEVDRGDEKLDSLKFIKKDRLRWLTQASSADTIIQALDKCGLGEGDALSRKRRRYQRSGQAPPCSAKALGKRRRAVVSSAWREDRHDPLTKLRVFKAMKKGKGVSRGSDMSVSDVEDQVDEEEADERMELSDIEWYTRQAVEGDEWDEDDDLDMSEVELGVMASPRRSTPEPEPYKPVVSFAEVNNVPTCLYRPLSDIIEEVYLYLGLDTTDQRGIKLLHDQLSGKRLRTGKELGSVGVFPTRPIAAKDWAALKLSRKILRRDRLAKCAIYRFTFTYPRDSIPSRFLRWQTWNHPTLDELRNGLKLKLDERECVRLSTPSSPAAVDDELEEEVESGVDDLLSVIDVDDSVADDASDASLEDTVVGDEDEDDESGDSASDEDEIQVSELDEAPATPRRQAEAAEEREVLCEALGLTTSRPIAPLPRTPIYSRLPRSLNDSPPSYTERMYRDRSPTPPPPFNAQSDNTVVIPPRFSPQGALPRLLPPFSLSTSSPPRRPRARVSTPIRPRNTSGEIIMPGGYSRSAVAPVREVNTFDLALDMEEAETELELATLVEVEPEAQPETTGLVSWGAHIVRSWWSR